MLTAAMVGGWVDASTLRVSPVEGGVSSVSPVGRDSMVRSAVVDMVLRELGVRRGSRRGHQII